MADLATLKTRLTEAEDALHTMSLPGSAVVEVRRDDGTSVQFQPVERPRLEAYIAALRRQIARAEGTQRPPKKLVFL